MLHDMFSQNLWLQQTVQAFILLLIGMLIARIGGRKSISQMTVPTLIVVLALGTVLVEPLVLKDHSIITLWTSLFIILLLVTVEILTLKFEKIEKIFVGHAKVLVEKGQLQKKNLIKTRITVDQLESQLRLQQVQNFKDCEYVTLEPNGQIGIQLKKEKQPVTNEELDKKLYEFFKNGHVSPNKKPSHFEEVKDDFKHIVDKELE